MVLGEAKATWAGNFHPVFFYDKVPGKIAHCKHGCLNIHKEREHASGKVNANTYQKNRRDPTMSFVCPRQLDFFRSLAIYKIVYWIFSLITIRCQHTPKKENYWQILFVLQHYPIAIWASTIACTLRNYKVVAAHARPHDPSKTCVRLIQTFHPSEVAPPGAVVSVLGHDSWLKSCSATLQ